MNKKESAVNSLRLEISNLEEKIKEMPYYPKYKGSIVTKYVTCGKPVCRCLSGSPHGPYTYLQYYNEDRQLRYKYLSKKVRKRYFNMQNANRERKKALRELKLLKLELRKLLKSEQEGYLEEKKPSCG